MSYVTFLLLLLPFPILIGRPSRGWPMIMQVREVFWAGILCNIQQPNVTKAVILFNKKVWHLHPKEGFIYIFKKEVQICILILSYNTVISVIDHNTLLKSPVIGIAQFNRNCPIPSYSIWITPWFTLTNFKEHFFNFYRIVPPLFWRKKSVYLPLLDCLQIFVLKNRQAHSQMDGNANAL